MQERRDDLAKDVNIRIDATITDRAPSSRSAEKMV
jgi:hypothetical protein